MSEAENKPSIRIHLDQQVTIEAVRGHEEVEDALVATEITGFDVEDDLYVLRGALSFNGFLRQEDPNGRADQLPDALDDADIFATDDAVAEAPVLPFHHRLPFILQVPVAAQVDHQRENGILNVNPKIGQWNVHVLGEHTVHLRAELVIQGLSATEGYVFRCGTQEEGVAASKLDTLLDQEEVRNHFVPPTPQAEAQEFEAPFEPAPWSIEEGSAFAEQRVGEPGARAEEASEDDWVIESAVQQASQGTQAFQAETVAYRNEQEDEEEVVFTPDPNLVFPMPDPGSEWARQLEAVDRAFGEALNNQQVPYFQPPTIEDIYQQAQEIYNAMQNQFPNQQQDPYGHQGFPGLRQSAEFQSQFPAHFTQQFQVPQFQEPQFEEPQFQVPEYRPDVAFEVPDYHTQVFPQPNGHAVDEQEAFVLEDQNEVRHPEEPVLEEFTDFNAPGAFEQPTVGMTPALEADTERPVVAEYEFEDEVAEQEFNVNAAPEVVKTTPKAGGPKLSVGGKGPELVESPIKLSALLGDSRARVPGSAAESTFDAKYPPAAQLIRESQSYSESPVFADLVDQEERESAALVHTSKTGHSDSIWADILLGGQESKVTMKFRIVHEEDNLDELAEQYNTSVNDLVRANNLTRSEVEPGEILFIPTRRR